MHENSNVFSISKMANLFGISRSGFYVWLKEKDTIKKREKKRNERDIAIKKAFEERKGQDGSRKIRQMLLDDGIEADLKTVIDSMRRQNLTAKSTQRLKRRLKRDKDARISPNRLERNFVATKPNQKWVTDITYLATTNGWLYLAVFIDLYSRKVIGWSMNDKIDSALVCNALMMALSNRNFPQNVLIHSDQGTQYCSNEFRKLLSRFDLTQSMSRKGNCWDNACAESFFKSLKTELIPKDHLIDSNSMQSIVFEYIEIDYNRRRKHSYLGYVTPNDFEKKVDSQTEHF